MYSIKLWGCVGGLLLCTGELSGSSSSSACSTSHFSPSGDHLTELAFRDMYGVASAAIASAPVNSPAVAHPVLALRVTVNQVTAGNLGHQTLEA